MAHCNLALVAFILVLSKVSSNIKFEPDYYSGVLDCDIILEKYAKSASNFTLCSLLFSRPIRVCEMCFDQYYNLTDRYNDIKTSVNGSSCKDVLLNVDRLQIVETYHHNLMQIWNRGFCDKCLNTSKDSPSISNETTIFFGYHVQTEKCINTHKIMNDTNEVTCKSCMKDYLTLNSFYESLKGSSETMGICMDIVDSMNATRSMWSSELKCCKLRQSPEIVFLLCTALISTTPIVFYVLAKFFSQGARTKVMGQHRLCETFPEYIQDSPTGQHSEEN